MEIYIQLCSHRVYSSICGSDSPLSAYLSKNRLFNLAFTSGKGNTFLRQNGKKTSTSGVQDHYLSFATLLTSLLVTIYTCKVWQRQNIIQTFFVQNFNDQHTFFLNLNRAGNITYLKHVKVALLLLFKANTMLIPSNFHHIYQLFSFLQQFWIFTGIRYKNCFVKYVLTSTIFINMILCIDKKENKSLTDTCLWKFGLWPCNSFSGSMFCTALQIKGQCESNINV